MHDFSRIPDISTPSLRAIFLDRDGTVMEDRHYLAEPDGVQLLPGVGEALGRLCAAGIQLFLVTNQSGIGRGYFDESDLNRCQARLSELLEPYGAFFTDVRFCPHAPDVSCDCRKPNIGMWESLAEEHNLSADHCAMVGDKPADVLFGVHASFAASFLVLTGKGTQSAEAWGATLPSGLDLARLGTASGTPVLNFASTQLSPPLSAINGGSMDVIPCELPPALHDSGTALWVARDLNAVADKVLSS